MLYKQCPRCSHLSDVQSINLRGICDSCNDADMDIKHDEFIERLIMEREDDNISRE